GLDSLLSRILRKTGWNFKWELKKSLHNSQPVKDFFNTLLKYPLEAVSVYAAAGLSSTAEDLCRFGDSLTPHGTNRLLSDSSLEVLLTTQPNHFSDKLRGRQMMSEFGWEYSDLSGYLEQGIQVLGKGGNTDFYS
ncbi:MAG: hypothetical protein ACLFSF_02905, partial [Desulfonatronovibrio sp.]